MSNNVLPNLSEWHLVPRDATLPARTPYYREGGSGAGYLWRAGALNARTPEDRFSGMDYYTEKPIEAVKETLEDVIRGAGTSIADIARAVEAFYAEQKPEQPSVIIDTGADEWRLNAEGTYDLWYGDEDPSDMLVSYTRERIEAVYGIQEERY